MGAWSWWSLWQFVTGLASVGTLIGFVAAAVAILMPPLLVRLVPNLRTLAVITAVAAFSFTAIAAKFYGDGLAVQLARWDEAKEAARVAREQLEKAVAEKAAIQDQADSAAEAAAVAAYEKARNEFIQNGVAGVCTLDDDTIKRLRDIK